VGPTVPSSMGRASCCGYSISNVAASR
jgi:hypothetical protein